MANVTYRFAGIPYGVVASVRAVSAPTVEITTVTGTINGYGDASLPIGDYFATYSNLGQTYQVGGDLASRADSDIADSTADAATAAAAVKGLPAALTGATQPTRYVGRWAATGAPASGTFAVGDFGFDGANTIQLCTVAGTPGTWVTATGTSSAVYPAVPSLDGDDVLLTIPAGALFGIDGDGIPYFDPDGAAVGEEAILVVGTDGTPAVTTIGALA
jgi:hypothetical protein